METAMGRRRLILGAATAVALAVPGAFAQTYPSRPIEFVVHTAPGGGTDIIARVAAEILTREKLVNQPVNVINRPGGAGAIAYTYFKGKRGDPHTVLTVASMTLLIQTLRPETGMGLEHFTPLAYAKHLAQRRVLVLEFLQSVGMVPKP